MEKVNERSSPLYLGCKATQRAKDEEKSRMKGKVQSTVDLGPHRWLFGHLCRVMPSRAEQLCSKSDNNRFFHGTSIGQPYSIQKKKLRPCSHIAIEVWQRNDCTAKGRVVVRF